MADRNVCTSSHNGSIRTMVPKSSPGPHKSGSADLEPGDQRSRTAEDDSRHSRTWGQNLASVLRYRTRTNSSKNEISQEEPEALLDLILESQNQRLSEQRASLSLLPDPPALCGTCGAEQPVVPGWDFYNMLIQYQADRMEDQRCSLPHLDHVGGPVPEDQENFFSLVQRVQSRRMDEQRASMRHDENHLDLGLPGSSHHHHHHH